MKAGAPRVGQGRLTGVSPGCFWGGIVRGDDRSSRYPPRGVWFGLFVAVGTVRALLAQDVREDVSARRLADPIVLAANRVTKWQAAGAIWVRLTGNASVLQGVEGLRAREAIVRIVDESIGGETIRHVDFYAEGDVRLSGANQSTQPSYRGVLRTNELQIKSYDRAGPQTAQEPPWALAIIRRSGFLVQKPVAAAQAPASDEIVPAPRHGQRTSPVSLSTPEPGANALVATQAVAAVDQLSSQAETSGAGGAALSPAAMSPRRDPMIRRALNLSNAEPVVARTEVAKSTVDSQVQQASAQQVPAGGAQPPDIDLPPITGAPEVQVPNLTPNREDLPPNIEPLPAPDGSMSVPELPRTGPVEGESNEGRTAPPPPVVPFMGNFRTTSLFTRSGRRLQIVELPPTPDGVKTYIFRGGINLVTRTAKSGTIDIEADEAVIWRAPNPNKGEPSIGPNGETWVDDSRQPMEVYLEGNVILRQDENKFAGKGDQRTVRAPRLYYDFLTDRFLAPNAEIDMFAPSLLAPVKIKSPRIEQFRRPIELPNGTFVLSEQPEIRAEPAVMTGSRFPDPGYKLSSSSIDLTRHTKPLTNPNTGQEVKDPDNPDVVEEEQVWRLDARQNIYWAGPLPVFYWPHVLMDLDDLEPPVRMIGFATNNYFGQQLRVDFNGFRLINQRRPKFIDIWNVDVDYLSVRTKDFPAIGSEMGWYGTDLIQDLSDPYRKQRDPPEHITKSYFGYFDIWGLKDAGVDVLGTGPAIVTNGPVGAGKAGFQRTDDPPFQSDRGRFNLRHNQRFLPEDDEHQFEELRVQLEVAYASDRNFIEEYYKRLFDTGLDQETLAYGIWQKDNQIASIWTEGNFQNWYTDTQWLPRVDYYRLGDSFLNNLFTYYTHSGMDYATIHTDIMVNNNNLFAFLPFDPTSNTTGTFSSGRFYTNHELDMPLNLGNVVRLVPYVQGQAVGWTDQLGGGPLGHEPTGAMGRIWGAAGLRAEVTAWKKYPDVESELLNIHGLNNKISLFTDARSAWSNQELNKIAVQDDLNDNTYEYVLRYSAITQFVGGLLPFPYDPRHLILRQTLSPITDTTDVQASINTVQLGVHQRLQTKRGPIGRRRIVDYMTLDASTTYFPTAARDNFGTPWGQAMYNYQWYIGDRTSIVSAGWFDFFKLVGGTPLPSVTGYNPNGLNIITSGVSISRPPRSNIFLGYTIVDTGPIKTSAINVSLSYWLSPKWFGTFSESYDFGDAISLGSMFAFTRIGADYLTTIGLTVDPQRQSYMFAFQITPRLSPGLGSGSTSGTSFDTRFAPTQ
jgi:hypothetical protein